MASKLGRGSAIKDALSVLTLASPQIGGAAGGAVLGNSSFLVLAADASLTAERVMTVGSGLGAVDSGAGAAYTLSVDATVARSTWAVTAGAGMTGGGNLAAAGITLNVIAGSGITVNANDVALTVPGTLTVATANAAAGSHTHAITSSSNPGAAASLLASTAAGYLQLIRLGAGIAPAFPLHAASATEQLRLEYNSTNYASFTVASDGGLTIDTTGTGGLSLTPVGDITFDPAGNDILPATNYDLNLGSINKKYLTLHAAELWVETLVAEDTIATIGGRILVGPTTVLTSDIDATTTAILVEHNQMAVGDRAYLEAAGKVEFLAITAGPTGVGPYGYTVTRNLDGTGGNLWYAGDAVFNTGTTGDGFIDLYSFSGVRADTTVGPTIVGNVRLSATYNDWVEHWAVGNLIGLFGYAADTYGAAFGKYSTTTSYLTADATNGIRMMRGTTMLAQWEISGTMVIGQVANSQARTSIAAGKFDIIARNAGGTDQYKLTVEPDGDVFIGSNVSNAATTSIAIFNNAQTYNTEAGFAAGDILIGDNSASMANMFWDLSTGRLNFRGGQTTQLYISTTGALVAGSDEVILDSNGLTFIDDDDAQRLRWMSGADSIAYVTAFAGGGEHLLRLRGWASTTQPASLITIEATSFSSEGTAGIYIHAPDTAGGHAYIALTEGSQAGFAGTFAGVIIGNRPWDTVAPDAMLDVRGDAIVTGNLTVGVATATASANADIVWRDTATDTRVAVLTLQHRSSGTPAAAFGMQHFYQADSSNNTLRTQAVIETQWVVATDASRTARLNLYAADSGASRLAISMQASGTAAMVGFMGATPIARPTVTGSRGANAALASALTQLAALGLITDSSTA